MKKLNGGCCCCCKGYRHWVVMGADDEGEDQEGTVFIVVDYYVSDVNSFQIQIIANRMGSEQFTNHLFIVSYLNTKTGFRNSRDTYTTAMFKNRCVDP